MVEQTWSTDDRGEALENLERHRDRDVRNTFWQMTLTRFRRDPWVWSVIF